MTFIIIVRYKNIKTKKGGHFDHLNYLSIKYLVLKFSAEEFTVETCDV